MSKKTKFVLCGIFATVSIGVCIVIDSAFTTFWAASTWILLSVLIDFEDTIVGLRKKTKEQEEYIKEADEHIHFLTQHDTMKQLRQAKTESRVYAANCYHYLMRIGQLKAQNEQLRILNKNLI